MPRHSRRTFLTRLGWGALGLAIVGGTAGAVAFISQRTSRSAQLIEIAPLSNLSQSEPVLMSEEIRVQLIRHSEGIQAISSLCTYDGCSIRRFELWQSGVLQTTCPCCGSMYSPDGFPKSGPATKPLPFYAIHLSRQSILQVDLLQNDLADEYVKLSGEGISNRLFFNAERNEMIYFY